MVRFVLNDELMRLRTDVKYERSRPILHDAAGRKQ